MSDLKTYTVGEVTVNYDSRRVPVAASERKSGPYPYYGASGIVDSVDSYLFDGDYLLIAEDGENLRTRKTPVAFIASGRFWVNNHAHVLQGNHLADSRYLGYVLTRTDISGYLSGSTQPKLTQAAMNQITIQLPERQYQESVVAMLSALDNKIACNDRIAEKSRDLITLRYGGAVASGVKTARMGEIAELFDGPHATPKKISSGPWFLSISSLSNGRLALDESAHLSEDDFVRWTRRVTPKAGDVLFSYETRLGDAALMPKGIRACLGRRMALLRPHGIGSRTLLQAFLAPSFQETIRQYAVYGATVDRIPLTEFPSWRIELPTEEPDQLESILAPLDDSAQERERENETLAALRDTLLSKLMSGQIRVRDAEKVVEDVT
jgi:type I restriction enzyme, S subunit